MKLLLPLLLFLGSIPLTLPAQEPAPEQATYFASNEFGLALKPIEWYRTDEYTYVLKREEENGLAVETLLKSGRLIKRWERMPGLERVYEGGELTVARSFDESGRVLVERRFVGGEESTRTMFHYSPNGISYTETYSPEGELICRDDYLLSARGGIRELRRTWAGEEEKIQEFSSTTASGRLYEEYYSSGDRDLIYRFDSSGNMVCRELWKEDQLAEKITHRYSEGRLDSTLELNYETGEEIRRGYDDQGRVVREVREKDGQRVEEITYEWDEEGRKIGMQRIGPEGLEKWIYHYSQDGSLVEEEYHRRGSLEKITLYPEPEGEVRIEELYRKGKLFLRITYREEERIREEFIQDGEVIRVKE